MAEGTSAGWREWEGLPWLALVVLGVIGYWELIAWDPHVGIRGQAQGAEGILFEPTAQSPLLILGLAAWLVWRRSRRIGAALRTGGSPVLGAIFLVPAVFCLVWAHYIRAPDLMIPSLQLLLLGIGAALGGRRGLAVMRLPAALLFLAIPIPAPLLNQLIFPLQLATARTVGLALSAFGYESLVLGDHVAAPWAVFHVIETCSGLRLVQTMMMASIVYGEVFELSVKRATFLFLISPIVGLVVNIARVLTIVFGPFGADFSEHTIQGIAMVVVGVLVLAWIDSGIDRIVGRSEPRQFEGVALSKIALPTRAVGVLALFAFVAVLPFVAPRWSPPDPGSRLDRIPRHVKGWTGNSIKLDTEFLGSVNFSNRVYKAYEREGERIRVLIGESDRLDRRRSIASPKVAYPGAASKLLGRDQIDLAGQRAELALFRSPDGLNLVLYWDEGIEELSTELVYSLLGLDRGPLRRDGFARVWQLSTLVDGSVEQAATRLVALATALREFWAGVDSAGASQSEGRGVLRFHSAVLDASRGRRQP